MADRLRVAVVEQGTQRGIAGVAVTTGDGVETTVEDGTCEIDVDPVARFVWISRPQGKRPVGDFYHALPTTEEVVFELADEPASRRDTVRLAQFSDTHVVGPGERVAGPDLAAALQGLVEESSPDLIIASGDLTNRGTDAELAELQSGIRGIDVPLFLIFGGHDGNAERRIEGNEPSWTLNWEACFGPTYYSFDWGGRHIALWPNEGHFFSIADRERKRRWLDADLAVHADRGNTILVTHLPPPADFIDEMRALGVSLILHGHWHSLKAFRHNEVTVAATGTLCFGGIDTTPRGYRLIEWTGSSMSPTCAVALGAGRLQPATPERIGPFHLAWAQDVTTDPETPFIPAHRAAPTVASDRMLLAGGRGDAGAVQCRSATTGGLLWTADLEAPVRNAVSTAGEQVLALAMTGALYNLRLDDGSLEWRADLEGHPSRWLYTTPIHDGMVFAGGKAGLGAYRLMSGERVWYTEIEANDAWSCYASPLVTEEVVVLLLSRRGIVGLSRVDGSLVWETRLDVEYQYAAPLRLGDDVCSGGNRQHLARVRLADGEVLWHRDIVAGRYPSGLAADDERLYAVTPAGAIQAFDPDTGQPLWRVDTGDDLLDMTPYARGGRSLLASPVRLGPWLLVGANDGVLRVLDPASGKVHAQAELGAPITAPAQPLHGGTGFLLSTWDGRVLRYDGDEAAAR